MQSKTLNRRTAIKTLAVAYGATALPTWASTEYPNRPISWVVPYSAGAATDILTRILAKDIAVELGQPIAVENVPGAGTVNAAVQLTRAKPDGYRMMTADSATLSLNPALMAKLPYDAKESFSHIGMFARFPLYLVVHKDVPANTLPELLNYILVTKKSDISYGSAGMGSPHHMAMELLQEKISSKMVHVPYAGAGPALNDLLGGRIELMFSSLGPISSHLKTGALKVIGCSGEERFPTTPDIPTMSESHASFNDFSIYAWQGVVGTAPIPPDVLKKWNAALLKVSQSTTIKKQFLNMGVELIAKLGNEFTDYAKIDREKWISLAKARNLKRD